jgi:hypothetical protein
MRSARWVASLVVAVAMLAPAQALAHGGNPNFRSVIDGVSPTTPNVSFEVLDYDSYMQLMDQHGHEVMIYGYQGEPYARILKNGEVQVNQRSPATYLNDNRFAEVTVPKSADAKAKPVWKEVDDSGTFIWHDHRMHYMSKSVPPQVKNKGTKTKIFDYEIPVAVDGKKGAINGTLFWVGSASTSKLPFIIAAIVIVLGGGALVLYIRRRRNDGDGDDRDRPELKPKEPVGEAW